jgi:1,4-dihydroxy-2-naphthoate octaprenyltransferase
VDASVIPKPVAWFRVARLQFYPMVILVYGAGAAAAAIHVGVFDWTRALLAYACLFLLELATVLTNEHFDFESDRVNLNASKFTGGSRMLVEGALTHREVVRAAAGAVVLVVAVFALLFARAPLESRTPLAILMALGLTLGLGYTAPPLKLSYRGLGEVDVAFTHATYALLFGWVAQGGSWRDPLPYLLSLPVFCAVLSANTIAGIPDHAADASVRKRSYSVAFGPRGAAAVAIVAAVAASLAGVLLWTDGIVRGKLGAAFLLTIPHALALGLVLTKFIRSGDYDRRIDPIMVNALNFIVWFGLIPFVYFLWLARASS